VIGLFAVFLAVSFEGEPVDEFEAEEGSDPIVVATTTPVLTGPQGDGNILENPDNLTEFCLNQFFAEAQCAGVVRELCAEVGSTHPDCIEALAAYCSITDPLATYCPEESSSQE
jgi:hypothetical protein